MERSPFWPEDLAARGGTPQQQEEEPSPGSGLSLSRSPLNAAYATFATAEGQDQEPFLLDESAVLEFLADCEMAEATETPSGSIDGPYTKEQKTENQLVLHDSSRSPSSSEEKGSGLGRGSWRQRRKAEVLHLREVVKQLSSQLEELKLQSGVRSTLPSVRRGGVGSSQPLRLEAKPAQGIEAMSLWEGLAARQSRKRELAELDNASLRDALRQQKYEAKALQRLIKRRLRNEVRCFVAMLIQMIADFESVCAVQAMGNALELCRRLQLNCRQADRPSNNEQVFQQLVAGLDEIYASLDGVFHKLKMHELPCPGRQRLIPSSQSEGLTEEILDRYVLPFDARRTEKMIWKLSATDESKGHSTIFDDHFPAGDSTDLRSFCFTFSPAEGMNIRILMRSAFRKYVERDRTVFIARNLIEPMDVDGTVPIYETLRMVVSPGTPSACGETTVMESHRYMTSSAIHDGSSQATRRLETDDGGANSLWSDSITRTNQRLEDALVREVLQAPE
ncbi:hypothetical protein BBJ28_00001153 [Nothophytophthora sp. Chile5]|nr:hypothetical protein BBJ28_00001153 [Nothophytophthora sp. Chile5]